MDPSTSPWMRRGTSVGDGEIPRWNLQPGGGVLVRYQLGKWEAGWGGVPGLRLENTEKWRI